MAIAIPPAARASSESRSLKLDLEDVAGRIFMVLWFTLAVGSQAMQLTHGFAQRAASPTWLLDVAHSALLVAFSTLAVALTVLRRPSKAAAVGLEPRLSAIIGTFLIVTITLLPPVEVNIPVKVIALIIMTIGVGLSVYCLAWLGQSYSIMATARKLVTGGPYCFVRHPLYAAELLGIVGITLANFSLPAIAIFLATAAFQLRRAINEEGVLRAAFPEYEQYSRQVPRFIPRLQKPRP
jgi:protein-S-isoprenylcysteine O-methyltransferase Ste14